jgi:putative inorganic carbon (HCO3(-)) transporter
VELTGSPFSFEILQIESVALFFVLVSATISTWNDFRVGGATVIQNRDIWVMIGVFVFLSLTAAFTYSLGISQFLLALELAFGIVLAALRPANALSLFICLQFLRPWEIAPDDNQLLLALPRMTGLLAIASGVASYLRSERRRVRFGKGQWFLLAFATWAFITTIFAPDSGDQQKLFFDTFFRAVIIFFLIVATVRKREDLELLRQVYLWSVAGLAFVSIYVSWDEIFKEGGSNVERLHAVGTLENANDIAAVMVIGIPFALRRLSTLRMQPLAWLESLFFLGLTLFALYLAQSRGAVLALAAAGIGWWVLRSRGKWKVVVIGALIVACAAPFANSILRRDSEDLDESGSSRITYWKAGLKMVLHSPVFGVGFGRYPKEYQANAGGGEQFEFGERTAHSTWILALAETGVPGFFFFVAFVLSVFRMGRRNMREEPDLFVALIAYLIAISFLSHTYLIYPYILFAFVVAGYRIRYRSEKGWAM